MTNEDILSAIARDYHSIEPDSDLHMCVRALVAQAFEEVAQIKLESDSYTGRAAEDSAYDTGYAAGVEAYRERVSALKDALTI